MKAPIDARINLRLTRRQRDLLRREAERLECTVADLVRRVLDQWLDVQGVGVLAKRRAG